MTAPVVPPITPATDQAPADPPATGEPADLDGYKDLVAKLRDEVKAAKADHTPQAEKDAATIAALKRQIKDAEPKVAEYDRLAEASKTELERAQESTAKANERAAKLIERTVQAEIKAAATGFADPSDAVAFLSDTSKYAGDDGEIDTKAIAADLKALLESKPHLAGTAGPRAPLPDPSLNARPPAANDIDGRIAEAEKAGNFALSISLKRQKAAQAAPKR